MPTELNQDEVERRLARLQAEYGAVDVAVRDEVWAPEDFADSVELAESGYLGGAHVFTIREPDQTAPLTESMPPGSGDSRRRVLLALGRGSDEWGPPGGGREAGETYEEAAVREVSEETGIDCAITDLVDALRWNTRSSAEDDDRVVHTLFVRFEARYVGGTIEVQPGELNGAAWFAELPERQHEVTERWAPHWDPEPAGSPESGSSS